MTFSLTNESVEEELCSSPLIGRHLMEWTELQSPRRRHGHARAADTDFPWWGANEVDEGRGAIMDWTWTGLDL